jgi:hypothetical protein
MRRCLGATETPNASNRSNYLPVTERTIPALMGGGTDQTALSEP